MRKTVKRMVSLLLCLVLMTALVTTVWAAPVAEDTDIPKLDAAELKAEWKKDQNYTLADPAPWNLNELKQVVDVKDPRSVAAYWLWAVTRLTDNYNDGMEMMKYLFADLEPYGSGYTEGGVSGKAGWETYFNERLTSPDYKWLPRAYFEGATKDNGLVPTRPLTVELYYNNTNTETINAQALASLGRLTIVYWVKSYAAGHQVNINVTKFAGSDRWYVTSGTSSKEFFYDQRGGLTQTQKNLAASSANENSTAAEHAAKYGGGSAPVEPAPATYTVTYNANGGTVSPASATTNSAGTLALLPTPTRDGYTFNGWFTAATGGSKVDASKVYTADTTLYAQWSQNAPAQTNPFTDVSAGDYFYNAVLWAYYNKPQVTTGTTTTTFSPASTCTRGQVVTFLWRAKGEPEPTSTKNPFTDVKADAYYRKAVLWAVEQGITNGTSATEFSPNMTCSRAHIITFLWRCEGKPNDLGSTGWYTDAVNWANARDLLSGNGKLFEPKEDCPRADVVEYLYGVVKES